MDITQVVKLINDLKDSEFTGQLEINFHNGGMGKSYTRQQVYARPTYLNKKQNSHRAIN